MASSADGARGGSTESLKNVWPDLKIQTQGLVDISNAQKDPKSPFHKIVTVDGCQLRYHDVRKALTKVHVYQEIEDLRRLEKAGLQRHFPTIHSLVVGNEDEIEGVLMTFVWETPALRELERAGVSGEFRETLRSELVQVARKAHGAGYNWNPRFDDVHYYTTTDGRASIYVIDIGHPSGKVAGNLAEEGRSMSSSQIANLEDILAELDALEHKAANSGKQSSTSTVYSR